MPQTLPTLHVLARSVLTFTILCWTADAHAQSLKLLHGLTITAQVLDTHSTLLALDAGRTERNPLMTWVAQNPTALIGVKTAATVGFVFATQKLAKRHRRAAIWANLAVNAAVLAVAYRNYRAISVP